MKFKLYYLLPFFILGIIIGNENSKPMIIFLCVVIILSLLLLSIVKKNIFFTMLLCFFGLGILLVNMSKISFENKYNYLSTLREFSGNVVSIDKNNITIKNNENGYKVIVNNALKVKDNNKVNLELGDYIVIKGKVKEAISYRKNNMNSRFINAYITSRNIISIDKSLSINNVFLKIKNKISKGLNSIDKNAGAFVSGLVTGYRADMLDSDKEIFNELDIIHILAVSGFNIAIVYGVVLIVTKKISNRKRYLIAFSVCTLYVCITGFDPSITRAFIMITMMILGKIINKKYSPINGVTLAIFLMLTINPLYIYNLGFIYSFLATIGIAIFNRDIAMKIEGYVRLLKDEVSVSIAASIFTFPVSVYNKGYFSLISLLVNIVISPIVSFITVIGFISSFIYLLIQNKIVLYPIVFLGDIILSIIRKIGEYNIVSYVGAPSILSIIIYYIIILILLKKINFKNIIYKKAAIGILLSIIFIQMVLLSNNLKIHFINVGQGDSIFIETPMKKNILIDTGDAREEYIAAKSSVLPYIRRLGYNKIDYMIISHFHSDHSGGVDYLMDNIEINHKISYKGCEKEGYVGLSNGEALNINGVNLSILSPYDKLSSEDENKNSLIIDLKYKNFDALFTGDATEDEISKISGDYELYKVPHHGSKYSISEKMIENTKIESAVITVGKNNFGHPSKEVLNYLENMESKVYRSDKHGNIVYVVNRFGYKVKFNN